MTSISSKLEPTIWSHDSGQQTPCFDRCQLTITWMSNIKKGRCKPRLNVSFNLIAGASPPSWATLLSLSPPSCKAPTSNSASHDNHEKFNSWVCFSFQYGYGYVQGNIRKWKAASECNFHAERKSVINSTTQFHCCLLVSGLIFCIISIFVFFFGSLLYQVKNKLLQTTQIYFILARHYRYFDSSRLRASEDFSLFHR